MPSHPRRPAIAGAAQRIQRVDDPREAVEPLGLMEQAIRDAALDAGAPKIIEAIDAIFVPQGLWRYANPGRLLAERLGCPGGADHLGRDQRPHCADPSQPGLSTDCRRPVRRCRNRRC